MENSSEKSGVFVFPRKKRSLNIKRLYEPRVSEVGGSTKKVSEENDEKNVKKKKKRKSEKGVSLSCVEPDAKKRKKEYVYGMRSDTFSKEILQGRALGLLGMSLPLNDPNKVFIFPRRPRGSVGRKKMETDQVSEPLELSDSVEDRVIKPAGEDESVKLVIFSAGNKTVSNSKSAGNIGGSISKCKAKAVSKSAGKAPGSNSKLKQKEDLSSRGNITSSGSKLKKNLDLKSAGEVHCSNSKSKQKADLKPPGDISALDAKLKNKADLKSPAEVGGGLDAKSKKEHLKSTVEINGSDSKLKKKVDFKSKVEINGSESKSKKKVKSTEKVGRSGFNLKKKADLASTGQVGASNLKQKKKTGLKSAGEVACSDSKLNPKVGPKPAGEVGDSDSKLNPKADLKPVGESKLNPKDDTKPAGEICGPNPKLKEKTESKSTLKGGSSGVKVKRKAAVDGLKGSRKGKSSPICNVDKEDNAVIDNGVTSSKKRQSNNRKKKDLVAGRDGGEASKNSQPSVIAGRNGGKEAPKRTEPAVGSSFIDLLGADDEDDDEENLEQNAARMLSSRFDPSCTGFSSKRKSSFSQTNNGFSFPVSSSRDSHSRQADDDRSKVLTPKTEDIGKSEKKKRRHFYEILPEDLDPYWVITRRIKVFWPLDESWYHGLVDDYHSECKIHHIKYDDREEEWVDLREEKFKILLFPDEVPGNPKRRKRSSGIKDVKQKGETVQPADDTEPIALWLARSSERVKPFLKSLKVQKTSEKNKNSNVADPKRPRSKQERASSLGNGGVKRMVYVRKKTQKKGEGSCLRSRVVKVVYRSVAGSLPLAKKELWSIDDRGHLRLNIVLVESKKLRFQICLPVFPFKEFSLGTEDFWLLHDIFMLQHGVIILTTSPSVILEMLFVDSYTGLKFLLFEGCMKKALAFVCFVLTAFTQSDEHWNGGIRVPVTSIRFRLSNAQHPRKSREFTFHSFSIMPTSKWLHLDSKLLQRCLLIKQLPASECKYDNIKELECGTLMQCNPHAGLELSSNVGFKKKLVRGILPMGVSQEACNSRNSQSALSISATPEEVPQFFISLSAAPTFFLTRHLQLLMENNFASVNRQCHDALCLSEISENSNRPVAKSSLIVPEITAGNKIGTRETEAPSFKEFKEITPESNKEVNLQDVVVSFASGLTSTASGMTVVIPSVEQADGKRSISRQASDVSWIANEGFVQSPNTSTGSRRSSKRGRSSSISSPLGDLSPLWPDGRPNFTRKKPRTRVQYTLPFVGYEFKAKQKMQNPTALPCKRIRRASMKRIFEVSTNTPKNSEPLTCRANVLVTEGDKGWREGGAHIVLEGADHNEWKLAVKVSGITKYSYKVKHVFQTGSTNRYSHAMLWKGGKDWVLEFPDRRQWMLFKEMHEECHSRNIRAASVKNIPIPGVRLVEESYDDEMEIPFVRNSAEYFRQVQTDVEMALDASNVLYDMDSDDEEWLKANKKIYNGKRKRMEISEEFFETTIDIFEKASHDQRRDKFTDAEIKELVIGLGSVEAAKVVYQYWREKREKKGMPLIRHLQPPLWERYQQQLKEWEHNIARGNSEKPPMFAFCLKPRGLDVPNKGSKQRSHRKFSISGNQHTSPRDHGSIFGRRSNGHPNGFEKKLGSHPSSRNQRMNRNGVQKMGSPELPNQRQHSEGPHKQGTEQRLDSSDLQEYFKFHNASTAAKRARTIAKLKREYSHKLAAKSDIAVQKAAGALMNADTMKAARENSNGDK